jgi:NADPH:quinone reductase-like Zn-dependent oxidoreductase
VGPDFVLVIARGASVNPVDAKVVAATWTGLLRALPLLPVGRGRHCRGGRTGCAGARQRDEVLWFARRDEVQHGTYAELVPAPIRALARKRA